MGVEATSEGVEGAVCSPKTPEKLLMLGQVRNVGAGGQDPCCVWHRLRSTAVEDHGTVVDET